MKSYKQASNPSENFGALEFNQVAVCLLYFAACATLKSQGLSYRSARHCALLLPQAKVTCRSHSLHLHPLSSIYLSTGCISATLQIHSPASFLISSADSIRPSRSPNRVPFLMPSRSRPSRSSRSRTSRRRHQRKRHDLKKKAPEHIWRSDQYRLVRRLQSELEKRYEMVRYTEAELLPLGYKLGAPLDVDDPQPLDLDSRFFVPSTRLPVRKALRYYAKERWTPREPLKIPHRATFHGPDAKDKFKRETLGFYSDRGSEASGNLDYFLQAAMMYEPRTWRWTHHSYVPLSHLLQTACHEKPAS